MLSKNLSNTLVKPPVKGKPCIRCLIDRIDDVTAAEIVEKYKKETPDDEKAGDKQYKERLSVCLDCKYLNKGVCMKSGFYVEARMYRKAGKCPLGLF